MVSNNLLLGLGIFVGALALSRSFGNGGNQGISSNNTTQAELLGDINTQTTAIGQLEQISDEIRTREISKNNSLIELIQGELSVAQKSFQKPHFSPLSRTAANAVARYGSLEAAYDKLMKGGRHSQLQAGTILGQLKARDIFSFNSQVQNFIDRGNEQISLLENQNNDLLSV